MSDVAAKWRAGLPGMSPEKQRSLHANALEKLEDDSILGLAAEAEALLALMDEKRERSWIPGCIAALLEYLPKGYRMRQSRSSATRMQTLIAHVVFVLTVFSAPSAAEPPQVPISISSRCSSGEPYALDLSGFPLGTISSDLLAHAALVSVHSGPVCEAWRFGLKAVTPSGIVETGAFVDSRWLALNAAVSADGTLLFFVSNDASLVSGDTNERQDIFVVDLEHGDVRRVSLAASGNQANGDSDLIQVSSTGRYVALSTTSTNLGPAGAGRYVLDRTSGEYHPIATRPVLLGEGILVEEEWNITHTTNQIRSRHVESGELAAHVCSACSVVGLSSDRSWLLVVSSLGAEVVNLTSEERRSVFLAGKIGPQDPLAAISNDGSMVVAATRTTDVDRDWYNLEISRPDGQLVQAPLGRSPEARAMGLRSVTAVQLATDDSLVRFAADGLDVISDSLSDPDSMLYEFSLDALFSDGLETGRRVR